MSRSLSRRRFVLSAAACVLAGAARAAPKSAAPTGLVYHPDYLLHDSGPYHPERPDRLRAIIAGLETSDLMASLLRIEPRPATDRWITTVHTPAYLGWLEAASKQAPVQLDPDTRLAQESLRVARLAAGGVLAAVDAVVAGRTGNAFAAVRPPGHHALPGRAMGFCLLNNVAIAARYAQQEHGLKRVLIVDWDVHHGNGTQAMFYDDPSVLYFSTHQFPYYPYTGEAKEMGIGEGEGTTVNVPLVAGSGDTEIVEAFRDKLVPVADKFKPDFVLISAGFDAHRDDPLAGLDVTAEGYGSLTRIVIEIARRHAGGRIVSALEGGYRLEALSDSVVAHVGMLMGRN